MDMEMVCDQVKVHPEFDKEGKGAVLSCAETDQSIVCCQKFQESEGT